MTAWLLLFAARVATADPGSATPADARARLDEGWVRLEAGDPAGARLMAQEVAEREPGWAVEAGYLEAVTYQAEGAEPLAIAAFHALIDANPGHPRAVDARFRLGLTLVEAGEPRQALRAVAPLARRTLDAEDALRLDLATATWRLSARAPGRGAGALRALDRVLAALPDHALPALRAEAHRAVIRYATAASEQLDFDVPERRVKARLEARTTYVRAAEAQLERAIDLASVTPSAHAAVLHGLADICHAYAAAAEDLLAAPAPRRLTAAQAAIYDDGVAERATGVRRKALSCYDLGHEYVLRTGAGAWGPAATGRARIEAGRSTLLALLGANAPTAATPEGATAPPAIGATPAPPNPPHTPQALPPEAPAPTP